ncbi:protein argonaute 4B-like [Magnolia sinica]|uniref:protein argonaute 4B-like n=1 Tax=Magnolia sinica TaxID=86752 RepID=UPI00265917F9|nr:protein argonaute 4B-like [Magnolia sinica]
MNILCWKFCFLSLFNVNCPFIYLFIVLYFFTCTGTVVDKAICHLRNHDHDFYMCSHTRMIGTTHPTHYHVLLDEIGFSPDDFQELVHSLSYVYQRSTTAISIGEYRVSVMW